MKKAKFDPAKFGLYLKGLREKKKLSQLEIANKLGYKSSQFISNWERGLAAPPLKTLIVLSEAYGVPSRVLYGKLIEHITSQMGHEFEKMTRTGT